MRRGPELCCPNPDCPETRLFNLLAAIRNFGIERLGEPTLRKLIDKFGIRHLHQVLTLSPADILQIEGFQQRSAANLANELKRSRTSSPARLISALNIPNVGSNIATLLLKKYPFDQLRTASADELAAIPGIGPERAAAIVQTLHAEAENIDKLLEVITLQTDTEADSSLPTVCFTGKMPEKRSFYEKLARERNMLPVDSVNSSLSLLVAADISGSSSKINAAKKHNIKIISLQDFLAGTSLRATETAENKPEKEADFSEAWKRGELF